LDLLIRLSKYDEDWYVQAPATAALKTMLRAMPSIFRIFLARLRSDAPLEREHSATALVNIAEEEPELLDPNEIISEIRRLKAIGDRDTLKTLRRILPLIQAAKHKAWYKYGL